ncbi:hypothetical protein GCM10029978_089010 [Actinoallomurus acanthiterrae]
MCATCRSPVRSYQYRYYPATSDSYERCVGFAWCPGCSVFTGTMVHVPRKRVLKDALIGLPPGERNRLKRNEADLIEYLDGHAESAD